MTDAARTKSAIVTGGGTGIGRASASRLAADGWTVTISGRREEVLRDAAREVMAATGNDKVRTQAVDLSHPEAAEALLAAHVAAVGGIDAVVTSAASWQPMATLDLRAANWDTTMEVVLRGSVLVALEAARHMVRAGSGRIILISSINGFHSEPNSIDYSAAKAAVMSVARSMAVDLAPFGVTTNAVAPGWVDTPMTAEYLRRATAEQLLRVNPLGRAGRPEEIAEVVWFLAHAAPEFLTGTTIFVDGGQTALAPML